MSKCPFYIHKVVTLVTKRTLVRSEKLSERVSIYVTYKTSGKTKASFIPIERGSWGASNDPDDG